MVVIVVAGAAFEWGGFAVVVEAGLVKIVLVGLLPSTPRCSDVSSTGSLLAEKRCKGRCCRFGLSEALLGALVDGAIF